jgi:predicted ATPase
MPEAFVQSARLVPDAGVDRSGYPWDLPAVAQLSEGFALHPKVTYLIGENGSGKSTLLAGIAVETSEVNGRLAMPWF